MQKNQFDATQIYYEYLLQRCALAEPAWRLTFAVGWLENLRFIIQINYAGHPRFYSFRALGSLQFSLEHSLVLFQIKYSGTPLIRSPMGQKNLTVLMGWPN